ncbi:MAG: hypothetical protein WC005_07310, partial [Candidatus Nanopelagicales bacterium]
ASAAQRTSTFIATPNGMVGVSQGLNVYLPSARGTNLSFTASTPGTSVTVSVLVGVSGFGAASWTPTTSGIWTLSGTGAASALGSTQVSVVPTPTSTAANAPSQLQLGVAASTTQAYVRALAGSATPQGSVTLRANASSGTGTVLGTGFLQPTSDPLVSVAAIPWTPAVVGAYQVVATYNPQTPAMASSVSPYEQPEIVGFNPMVAYRFAPALRVGQTSSISAVIGANYTAGSVGFLFDGVALRGSVPTVNSVATMTWTPPSAGLHLLRAEFTGNDPGYSSVSLQQINVLAALPADQLVASTSNGTLAPTGSNTMTRGASTALAGVTTSGAPVLFSTTGPCVIAGSRINALGKGACSLTATSVGSGAVTPTAVTYPITVTDATGKR